MILDGQDVLSDAQAITSSAPSTNFFDAGPVRDIGGGKGVPFYIQCTQAATAAGAATVDFRLQTDSDPSFPSPVDLGGTGPIAKGSLVPGAVFAGTVPPGAKHSTCGSTTRWRTAR